jgi:tetratricopeptide (TPR) repeat protein
MAVMYSIKNETPKPITLQSQDYPPGLQAVLDRAFTKELDKRYQTAHEFRDDLAGLLPESSGVVTVVGASTRRTVAIAAGAAVLVLALGFTGWKMISARRAEANRNMAINHNQQGELYREEGNLVEAEKEFRQALMADAKYPVARHNLGVLAYRRGERAEADSLFREAARMGPTYPEPRFMLGVMAEARGDTAAADSRYRDAIAADSTYFGAYSNLGALLLDRGNVAEALEVLDRGLAHEPTEQEIGFYAYLLKNRGKAALAMGDTATARAFFERAAQTIPDDPELKGLLESL